MSRASSLGVLSATFANPLNVHIIDCKGHVRFNKLVDTGVEVLRFDSGGGFLTRGQITRNSWTIVQGHLSRAQMDDVHAAYHLR